jgi:Holliday junction DNA helicase RuvB
VTAACCARFGIVHRLDFTTSPTSRDRAASGAILGVALDAEAALSCAARAARRASRTAFRRVRDFAECADGRSRWTSPAPRSACSKWTHGFDDIDRRLLRTIIDKFNGGPVGVNSLSAAINEEVDAIEDIYEPYLIQIGFLDRTPRGRVATARAYEFFGLDAPGRDGRLW